MPSSSLQNHWVPVCTSPQLTADKPVGIRLYEREIVLWRTTQGIYAGDDTCAHHGAKLSLGKVCNERLQCPYHGWEYSTNGECVRIPAEPTLRIPRAARLKNMHSAVELAGIIWLHLEQSTASLPPMPLHVFASSYSVLSAGGFEVQTSFARMCENFMDVAHFPFVHEGTIGLPALPEVAEYKTFELEGCPAASDVVMSVPNRRDPSTPRVARFSYRVLSPLCTYYEIGDTPSGDNLFEHALMLAVRPVSEESSAVFFVSALRELDLDIHARRLDFELEVFRQDVPVLESVRPKKLPLNLRAELHLRSDSTSVAYRKYLQRLGIGYGTIPSNSR